MNVDDCSSKASGGSGKNAGCRLKEKTMELKDLIKQLKMKLDAAELASDIGNKEEARVHLRAAKCLLDEEFLKD